MVKSLRARFSPIIIAILSVTVALLLMLALNPVAQMTQTPFLLFFGAIVVSAWLGNIQSGVIATVLSTLISNFFFLAPAYTFHIDLSGSIRSFVFILEGIAISLICNSLRNTSQRLRHNLLQLQASEASFKQSEDKFLRLITANLFGVAITDQTGTIIQANDALLSLFGYTQSDINTKSIRWADLTPSEYQALDQKATDELHRFGVYHPFEKEAYHKNGHRIPILTGGALLDQGSTQAPHTICFYLDLTEQKQTEHALRNSEERFRLATQALDGVVYDWDLQNKTIIRSEGLYKLSGLGPEAIPTDSTAWFERIHPADRPAIEAQIPAILASTSDRFEFEYRTWHEQGHWMNVLDRAYIVRNSQGQPLRVVGFCNNITARKQAEEALKRSERLYRAIGETIDYGIWVCDPNGKNTYVSESFLNLIGLTQPEYTKFGWAKVLHPDQREATAQAWQECVHTGANWDREYLFRGVDGNWHPILGRGVPVRDEQGNILCWAGIHLDISRQKQVEAKLRSSEEHFRALIEHASDAIFIADIDGNYLNVNSSACQLLGYPCEALIGQNVKNLIHPSQLPRLKATKQALLAGETHVDEWQLRRQDGQFITVEISTKILPDRRWQAFVRDVSDRKIAEAALRLSEDRYRTLANAVPQLMWVNDAEGNVQFYNQRWDEYAGFSLQGLGTLPEMLIHPEDLPIVQETRNHALHHCIAYEIEVRLKRFDDLYCWHLARVVPLLDEQGNATQWFGTATDIQDFKQAEIALRHSEERYRYLAESIPQLVWTANAAGIITDVNQRWLDYTGLSLPQIQLKGWEFLVYPDDLPTFSQHWTAAQHNGTFYKAEGRMRRHDGAFRWFLHQAIPLKNEQGEVIRWFGTATDIEDQKLLEQQRDYLLQKEQAARETAERANRIKDEFLAVLSHELRSPLNPILGWTKLLQSRKISEAQTQIALETIERNAKLQTQLIDDLLDVSRILRGKTVLNSSSVNLPQTINAALDTVQLSATTKHIQIDTYFAPNLVNITGDPTRIQQIVWNLLSNAVKFTPENGQIEIRIEQSETHTQIQVRDNGKGINPQFLPHVFEYFRQEDGTTTRQFGGLGLGLAIVRHLTELHGGTVQADSPGEGQGATFTIKLPLLPTLDLGTNPTPIASPNTALNGVPILLVDDEADMCDLMSFVLKQQGATVTIARSASEALAALDRFQPALLISDIGMPQMDGYMLMRQIRLRSPAQGGQIPAIALTAYAGEADQKQALEVGFARHLAKPVNPEDLIVAIAALLQTHQPA